MSDTILEIKDLHVLFPVHKKWLPAVDGVNLKIEKGEITGVVGESGSGKSVMSQTILRLRDHDTNVRYEGEILFEGEDLLKQPLNKIRDIRGDRISVIFQDPLTSLSPVHTVGSQLSEVLTLHKGLNKEQAKEKAIEMLKLTGIPNPENCFKQYPYELSGGMQQRVMIAMALSCEPKLLIADEPTTALDVTIQEQILQLIRELNEKLGMSVLFITHDMGAVANLCHNVKVMYLGQVVEEASTEELFQNPLHPYTQGLLSCAVDAFMMRIVDVFMSVPSLLFIIVVYAFMPRNLVTLVGMLAFFSWTKVARVVRAQTLTLKERDFVIAAKALGVSQGTIIRKHIIPNLMPQIIVSASLSIANAILDESTLSFLGYGVQLPMASWGSMLQTAQKFILHNPIMAVAPGVMILVTVLCFNVLGDMLQQMLDPKLVK